MRCKCEFDNPEGARFCGRCGSPLGEGSQLSNSAAPPKAYTPMPAVAPRGGSSRSRGMLLVAVALIAAAGYWLRHHSPARHSGLYRISANGKNGFMDRSGKTVIAPQFDGARGFSEGLAAVKVGAKFGFIDTRGEIVITPQFDEVWGPFSEGLAPVQVGTKFGYINTQGLVAITPQFDFAKPFRNGRAAVKLAGGPNWDGHDVKIGHASANRYGYIDKKGQYIGMPGLLYVEAGFGLKRGWVDEVTLIRTVDDRIGILNDAGKVVIVDRADQIGAGDFADGLAPAAVAGKWGYVDSRGGWAIAPQYEGASWFTDGLAPVRVGQRWGLIDRSGKFVVNPQYDHVFGIAEGYAIVETGEGTIPGCTYCGNYSFITTKGEPVGSALFAQHLNSDGSSSSPVNPFSEGLAAVKTDGGWGFIDGTGKMVIDAQFDEARDFEDGLAFVGILGKEAYITKTGEFVVDPFPGNTVKAMKARRAVELQKIKGEWMGSFGRIPFVHMTVGDDGSLVVTDLIEYGQPWRGQELHWREQFRGELDRATLDLTAAKATLTSVSDNARLRYFATLTFNASKQTLSGDLADAGRAAVGRIELSRAPR